jgi:hypothetical protein
VTPDGESVSRGYILPRRASRRRRADPARTLSLCSLLASSPRAWRIEHLKYRQQERKERPARRCRGCVGAWMVRAPSMPRIAGRTRNCSRRTSSFHAEPYEQHGQMGTVVRPGRAHIARAQTASGAKAIGKSAVTWSGFLPWPALASAGQARPAQTYMQIAEIKTSLMLYSTLYAYII